jgi:MFS family permease
VTPDCERADRYAAVRDAGRFWLQAGAIDEAALKSIKAAVPDDRVRLGPVFRVLLFVFTIFAVTSGLAFVVMVLNIQNAGSGGLLAALGFVAGAGLAVATDYQIVRMRRSQGGTEAATSLLAIGYLMGAAAWCILEFFGSRRLEELVVLCLVGAALAGAAAWRWGYWLYAGAAMAALLGALAGLPLGRLWWIALPLVAAPFLLRLSESPRLPPAHRSSFTAVLVIALVALYFAVHLGSWEWHLLEEIQGGAQMMPASQGDALWWLSVAGATRC